MTMRVEYHRDTETENWWATSSDVPGRTALACTRGELDTLVTEAQGLYAEGWFTEDQPL